jgi:hypothetical protein
MCEELADGAGDGLPHPRQLFEPFEPALTEQFVDGLPHQANRRRGSKIGPDPILISALVAKQLRRLFEAPGNLFVDPHVPALVEDWKQTSLRTVRCEGVADSCR